MANKRLFLLDGMALVYRAHFALIRNPIFTSGGVNSSALFGFTNTLVDLIEKRTRYVRAMNMIIVSRDSSELATVYNENPAYFQMYRSRQAAVDIVCSEPYPGETGWRPTDNRTVQTL